ncbi:hypothetical protein [Nocardia sp. NPDC050406]|uniref:hypothetical protein n=1 Tax=Nocardia sp. NPDC050406 TaxID=3364318 RepID=UPI003788B510
MGYHWLPLALSIVAELKIAPDDIAGIVYGTHKRVVPAAGGGVASLTFWGRTPDGRRVIVWLRRLPGDCEDSAVSDYEIVAVTDMTPEQSMAFAEWEDTI